MAVGDNIDEINEKIRILREELNKVPDSPFKEEELSKAKEALEGLRSEAKNLNSVLDYTFKSFQSIINEMTKGKTATQNITSSVKKLTSINAQLLDQRDDINKLSTKELINLKKKSSIEFSSLKREQEYLSQKEAQGTLSEKETLDLSEIRGILAENVGLEASFNRQLDSALNKQQGIENSVGLTGALLKSIASIPGLEAISKYLNIEEAVKSMESFNEQLFTTVLNSTQVQEGLGLRQANEDIEKTTVALAALDERNSEVSQSTIDNLQKIQSGSNKNLSEDEIKAAEEYNVLLEDRKKAQASLNKAVEKRADIEQQVSDSTTGFVGKMATGIVGITKTLDGFGKALTDPAAIFTMLGKAMFSINSQVVDISKNLGTSYSESQGIRKEFSAIALSSEDTFYNTTRLTKAFSEYVTLLGFAGKLNAENVKAFSSLTERVGIASESAARLQFFAESFGKDLREQSETQAGITSQVGSQYGIQLNQKQILEAVGKSSAYTLVQFGGSVERLTEATAQAKALGMTLDQVNSIAGKLLNFESSITSELKAELLLGKDINLEKARLAALNNDQKTLMEEMNREIGTFSDFTNLNRFQQEAYADALGMSANEMSDMLLMEQFRTVNAQQFAALNGEEALERAEMLTTQQRFNDAMLKLQGVVADLVEGPLGAMAELLGSIAGNSMMLGTVLGALAVSQLPKLIKGFKILRTLAISKAVADIFGGNAMLGPIGLVAAGAGVGLMLGAIATATADDMTTEAPPGYGKKGFIDFEKGQLKYLNNNDEIGFAGTDLFKPSLANELQSKENLPNPLNNPNNPNNIVTVINENASIKETITNNQPFPQNNTQDKNLLEKITEMANSISMLNQKQEITNNNLKEGNNDRKLNQPIVIDEFAPLYTT